MYQDKDRQREANKKAQARFKAKKQGIAENQVIPAKKNAPELNMINELGNTRPVIPPKVIPEIPCEVIPSNTLTIDQIIAMPLAQAKALLASWAQDKGTIYQAKLGWLARQYDHLKGYARATA